MSRYNLPCQRDLGCYLSNGHSGDHAYAGKVPAYVPDPLTECWHGFGEPHVVIAGTGDRVLVADCRKCNTGAISLERAPAMTAHWLMEHLEGVEETK